MGEGAVPPSRAVHAERVRGATTACMQARQLRAGVKVVAIVPWGKRRDKAAWVPTRGVSWDTGE